MEYRLCIPHIVQNYLRICPKVSLVKHVWKISVHIFTQSGTQYSKVKSRFENIVYDGSLSPKGPASEP